VHPSRWLTLGSCAVTPQDPVTSAGASSLHWRPALNYTHHDDFERNDQQEMAYRYYACLLVP
jgi:hypothetical protein